MDTITLWEKFQTFRTQNPIEFTQEELERVERDILMPRKGVASDEYVDFLLWCEDLGSRQKCFAEFVEKVFPVSEYPKLLEVGCGKTARLSKILAKHGYQMTAMDPKVERFATEKDGVGCIADFFDWKKTELAEYDAVVAQEPCEATEHIVRACVNQKKKFVMALCGVPHKLLNGEWPQDAYAWYQYLQEIGGDACVLTDLKLGGGYVSHILYTPMVY